MPPMMAIDPIAVALSKRIAAKTGRRASEIYQWAAPLIKEGLEPPRAEEILTELCEIGEGLSLDQIMEITAKGES
jgi:hypothetical protein